LTIPNTIKVKDRLPGLIPGHVFRQGPFKFNPQPFGPESDRLAERIIDSSVQEKSLSQFLESPATPMIYCVTGNPDDSKALYFAAYLLAYHVKKTERANPIWHSLYGGFSNPLLDKGQAGDTKPSMLVLSNLTVNSTQAKLEKARDLITFFNRVPRIIVACGEDPISFVTTKLHVPVNGIAYFSESLMKRRMEVI